MSGRIRDFTIPMGGSEIAVLRVMVPLSEEAYGRIYDWLGLFRDTLVEPLPTPRDASHISSTACGYTREVGG